MYSFVTIFVRSNMQIEDYSFNDTNRENEVHQIVEKHQWIHKTDYYNYTVSRKKQDTKLLAITSVNIIRFSNFFH